MMLTNGVRRQTVDIVPRLRQRAAARCPARLPRQHRTLQRFAQFSTAGSSSSPPHLPRLSIGLAAASVLSVSLAYALLSHDSPFRLYSPIPIAHADEINWPADSVSSTGSGTGDAKEQAKATSKPYASPPERQKIIAGLLKTLGKGKVSTDEGEREGHCTAGGTWHTSTPPDVVVYAECTEDVVEVMKRCNEGKMPVVPYSGGTSLEGHITAPYGGVCLDMSRMDKVLSLNVADSDMTVQAGKQWMEINSDLEEAGLPLFFPLDPGPGATIGGMISTGCSGTNAVRYGTARGEFILNMTVVLADGKVIKTRSRARKSSAGFDLGKMFTGAEGTLGVVTEATIKLAPLLPTTVAICAFPSVKDAVEAVGEIVNRGVPIQCVELCDKLLMTAFNKNGETPIKLPEADSIFFKFQGSDTARKEAQVVAAEVAKRYGGKDMIFAKDEEQAKELWHIRKSVHWSVIGLLQGDDVKAYSTDMCVPVSHLPTLISQIQEDLKEADVVGPLLGHVGDGNIHCALVFHQKDFPKVDKLAHKMVERAIALDGTCTGEHGVGVGKKGYLVRELGAGTVEVLKSIKELMDPNGILNPGKLYPDDE